MSAEITQEEGTNSNGEQTKEYQNTAENKDLLYEPKPTSKIVRVLTVLAYMLSVSLAAIMLSLYYILMWNPPESKHNTTHGNEPKLERLIYQDMSYTTPESSAGIILTTDSGDTYDTTTGLKNSIFLQKLMSYAEDKFNLNETLY